MEIKLRERTRETVVHYFTHTQTKEIRRFLPQKARTVEEALVDYEKTLLPGAGSFGRSIYFNGSHVGDIWCYGIQKEDPNAMVSYCVFDKVARGKGVATYGKRKGIRLFSAVNTVRKQFICRPCVCVMLHNTLNCIHLKFV